MLSVPLRVGACLLLLRYLFCCEWMGKSSRSRKKDNKPSTPKAIKAAMPRIAKRGPSTVVEEAVPEAQPADEVITMEEPSKVSPVRQRGTPEPAEEAVPPEVRAFASLASRARRISADRAMPHRRTQRLLPHASTPLPTHFAARPAHSLHEAAARDVPRARAARCAISSVMVAGNHRHI